MPLIGRIDDLSGEGTSYLERFQAYHIVNDRSDEKCVSAFLTVIGQTMYQSLRNSCEPDEPSNFTLTQLKVCLCLNLCKAGKCTLRSQMLTASRTIPLYENMTLKWSGK
ncbi:hypothetical protein HOLleu_00131 [Holothuria leucospilota]|uniref:Uncharacterized protein n=1 Tax=Holothuria leucospilota TaxID=206669 RepID=A0A9Q1CNN0_HOLLE|nr:hypothetical protein HOLleu_00131 [Holothuria leucospilota]